MTITWRGRKSGSVSLFCHYLFGQREQRWLLLYDLAQRAPHPAVRRHRARLQERQQRPPRGRAVPGLRPTMGPRGWRPFEVGLRAGLRPGHEGGSR